MKNNQTSLRFHFLHKSAPLIFSFLLIHCIFITTLPASNDFYKDAIINGVVLTVSIEEKSVDSDGFIKLKVTIKNNRPNPIRIRYASDDSWMGYEFVIKNSKGEIINLEEGTESTKGFESYITAELSRNQELTYDFVLKPKQKLTAGNYLIFISRDFSTKDEKEKKKVLQTKSRPIRMKI